MSGVDVQDSGDLATAEVLVDAAELSELVGMPVRSTHLRHKPGYSTTGALVVLQDGAFVGWVQACHEEHLDKVRNAVRRGAERGLRVHVRSIPRLPGLRLAYGTMDTDPRLRRGLDAFGRSMPSVDASVDAGQVRILRYNPHRRIVLRWEAGGHDPQVVRVTADNQPDPWPTVHALTAAGVPTVKPARSRDIRRSRRVSAWTWFGQGNLAEAGRVTADGGAATLAGRALARLHAATGLGDRRHGPAETESALRSLARDLCRLDVDAAHRMAELSERVLRGLSGQHAWRESVVVHGDFSADQVLVGSERDVRLIDFDRMGIAPPALDLGSFAAVEMLSRRDTRASPVDLPLTSHMVEGYQLGGGALPDTHLLAQWTARALLTRVVEPFRQARPSWRDEIHQRLDQVDEVLAQ